VANWHFVFPYDEAAADWLAGEGFPHPPARPGNRLPTWTEVEDAAKAVGIPPDAPLAIELSTDGESLKMRGEVLLELRVLRRVSELCGQLWVYPDCGSPALVIDSSSSPEPLAAAWLASLSAEDSWRAFYLRAREV
jgi:hypothetical protein